MSRPNGRNFYPQNERAIFIAQDEHRRREQAVLTIVGDATKMLQAIQAQGK
jgi:hypothetical protein